MILRRFTYSKGSIPLEQVQSDTWLLKKDVLKQWQDAEVMLLQIQQYAVQAHGGSHVPLEFSYYIQPTVLLTPSKGRQQARTKIVKAQFAFRILAASLSWHLAVLEYGQRKQTRSGEDMPRNAAPTGKSLLLVKNTTFTQNWAPH